jgi:hypothetical protein
MEFHNKHLDADAYVCVAIPHAKKCFAWFCFHESRPVCLLMDLNRDRKLGAIRVFDSSSGLVFDPELAVGTVLYGSVLPPTPGSCAHIFVAEDVALFRGETMRTRPFGDKLAFLHAVFSKFLSLAPSATLAFSLATMAPIAAAAAALSAAAYPVHHIQYRSLHEVVPYLNVKHSVFLGLSKAAGPAPPKPDSALDLDFPKKPTPDNTQCLRDVCDFTKPQYRDPTVFRVQADIQFDIYHLFAAKGGGGDVVLYDIAYIPNFRCSRFMNDLFRNIRENRNLDFIEESDDEEDFQDTRYDKYVDLEKTLDMEFVFHRKFRRWVPMRIAPAGAAPVHVARLVRQDTGGTMRDNPQKTGAKYARAGARLGGGGGAPPQKHPAPNRFRNARPK